ncbi:MAG TPA: peptidylprolyl isomerase [Burkholderiales bacterium]
MITVNGVAVDSAPAAARELLRQQAVASGLLAEGAPESEADAAIERLLEREVKVPEPGEAECRRFYDAHPALFAAGELAAVRHILFQVTPGTPVGALRARAEGVLSELLKAPERFEALAREFSNCPSGRHGGNLGQLQRGESAPEFEQVVFGGTWTGIHSQLVTTRFGFHIVAVDRRAPGRRVPFEAVREQVAERLRAATLERALRQYVGVLAGQAELRGANLGAVATPLVR